MLLIPLIHLPVKESIAVGAVELGVFVHRAAAVRVEFTEFEIPCLLIEENIQPAHWQQSAVGGPMQDHLLQFRRKAEQGAVIGLVQVLFDHTDQDSPGLLQVLFQLPESLPGKIFGKISEFDRHSLVSRRPLPHLLDLGAA